MSKKELVECLCGRLYTEYSNDRCPSCGLQREEIKEAKEDD